MHTLEEKKETVRRGKEKLRKDMSVHSLNDLNLMANAVVADPMSFLVIDPRFIMVIQLCIGITLGELLIEREEAEMQKEKV